MYKVLASYFASFSSWFKPSKETFLLCQRIFQRIWSICGMLDSLRQDSFHISLKLCPKGLCQYLGNDHGLVRDLKGNLSDLSKDVSVFEGRIEID